MKATVGTPIGLTDARYLMLDCSNDPVTGELDLRADVMVRARYNDSIHLYLDQYSDNVNRYGRLYFRKSQSNTMGTVLETASNTYLGNIKYMGVNTSNEFAGGCYMSVQQVGDAGDYVPTRMEWATYSDVAVNDDQFVMNPDGTINTSGNLTVGGDLIVTGDDIFMTTNTANYFLMADGTNYNPTSPADARTGLDVYSTGEVDGIAGDYVLKAGDTMTGALVITPTADGISILDINQADGTAVFDVDTINRKITVTSGTTGQSTIGAGLIVNNDSGSGAINDFQVNSDTLTAIFVDASANTLTIGVPTTITRGLTIEPDTDTLTALVVNDTDSNNVLTVDTINNRVGIGTTSPTTKLTVSIGNVNTAHGLDLTSDDATGNSGRLFLSSSVDAGNSFGLVKLGTGASSYLSFTHSATPGTSSGTNAMAILDGGNVGIGVTDPDTKLEVFGSTGLKISFDATDNTTLVTDTNGILTITPSGNGVLIPTTKQLQFNDTSTYFVYSGGDLDLYTAADKTLELQTAVYKDINMAGYLLAKPASSAPGVATFVDEAGADTTIETYAFAVDEKVHGGFELQHDYKEGTDLVFHVHWQGIAAPSGTDNVQWRLTYVVARDGTTLNAAVAIDSPDTAIDTQYKCYRTDFTAITGTDFLIGDQFMFTLTRVLATGEAYAGDALIETAGIHYQIDTIGSRQIAIK